MDNAPGATGPRPGRRRIARILLLTLLTGAVARGASGPVRFPTETIELGGQRLTVEVADTEARQERGLMFRTHLARDRGMLFVFHRDKPRVFWMKNTLIPLSVGFFDHTRRLVDVQEMQPTRATLDLEIPRYRSRRPARYALEVNLGWFKRHGIRLGQVFRVLGAAARRR